MTINAECITIVVGILAAIAAPVGSAFVALALWGWRNAKRVIDIQEDQIRSDREVTSTINANVKENREAIRQLAAANARLRSELARIQRTSAG